MKPNLEVKSRRVGGATYQVPVEIKPERRTALAMRWLIEYAKSRPDHTMTEKLAAELMAASKNEGASDQEEGRYASDGGGQQGLRALSLVVSAESVRLRRSTQGQPVARSGLVESTGVQPGRLDLRGRSARQARIGPPAPARQAPRQPRGRRQTARHRSGKAWDESPG